MPCITVRQRRSCYGVRGSFPDNNKSAPLLLYSVTVGMKHMFTVRHPAPAGGFVSAGDPHPTETNLFHSTWIETELFSDRIKLFHSLRIDPTVLSAQINQKIHCNYHDRFGQGKNNNCSEFFILLVFLQVFLLFLDMCQA